MLSSIEGFYASSSARWPISYAKFWIWTTMAFGIMKLSNQDFGINERMTLSGKGMSMDLCLVGSKGGAFLEVVQ